MELSELIRNTRTKAKLSQADFAAQLGLGSGGGGAVSVSRWERGLVTPRLLIFQKMVSLFDIAGEWNDSGCWVDTDGDVHDLSPTPRGPQEQISYSRIVKASENVDFRRQVLKKYSTECQRIYENRTAGDFTWEGLLMSFFDEFA